MDAIITVKKRFSLGELRTGVIKLKPILEERTVLPNEHEQIVVPNEGADGLSKVTVEPVELIEKTITKAGVYRASDEGVGGYSVVNAELPVDMLQARVDATNNCKYLIYYYLGTKLDISRLDTSNATNMAYMFGNCYNLTTLDLSNFDTSKVTNMEHMFWDCHLLTTLDVSNFDTSNVTNMDYMFSGIGVTTLDISSFDTKNTIRMQSMFGGCQELITIKGTIDLYSATKTYSLPNIFNNTKALTGVTLKNIRISLQIGSGTTYGHLWELPYLVNAVKECWENPDDQNPNTLTIGGANLEKIANVYVKLITPTAEQVEADPYINFKLPCEECDSTDEGAMTLTAYAYLKNWEIK